MLAVLLLSICASSIIRAVAQTGKRANMAAQKALILTEAQNWIENCRAKGKLRTLVPGTSSVQLSVTGVPFPVTRSTSIALTSGYTDLYNVKVTMSWNANTTADQSGSLALESKVISPDD